MTHSAGSESGGPTSTASLWAKGRWIVACSAGLSFILLIVYWNRAFSIEGCTGECALNGLSIVVPMTGWWLLFTGPALIVGLVGHRRMAGLVTAMGLLIAGVAVVSVSYASTSAPTAPTGESIQESLGQGKTLLGTDLRGAAASAWPSGNYAIEIRTDEPCTDMFNRSRGATHSSLWLKVDESAIRDHGLNDFSEDLRARGWETLTASVDDLGPATKPRVRLRSILSRSTAVNRAASDPALPDAYVISASSWRPEKSGQEPLLIEAWTPCLRAS